MESAKPEISCKLLLHLLYHCINIGGGHDTKVSVELLEARVLENEMVAFILLPFIIALSGRALAFALAFALPA